MHIRFRVLFYISDRAISITNNCPLSLILSLAERVWPLSRSLWPIDAVFLYRDIALVGTVVNKIGYSTLSYVQNTVL